MADVLRDEAFLARVRERLVRALDPQVLDPFSPVPDRTDCISAVVHAHLAEAFPRAVPDPDWFRTCATSWPGWVR